MVINEYEEIVDGCTYIVKGYSDGHVTREKKYKDELSTKDQMLFDMAVNIEYLTQLAEMEDI